MADSSKENTEAIVDTIKSELAIGFKNCIDKIDTEKKSSRQIQLGNLCKNE